MILLDFANDIIGTGTVRTLPQFARVLVAFGSAHAGTVYRSRAIIRRDRHLVVVAWPHPQRLSDDPAGALSLPDFADALIGSGDYVSSDSDVRVAFTGPAMYPVRTISRHHEHVIIVSSRYPVPGVQ